MAVVLKFDREELINEQEEEIGAKSQLSESGGVSVDSRRKGRESVMSTWMSIVIIVGTNSIH